jgi:hypothetical protein
LSRKALSRKGAGQASLAQKAYHLQRRKLERKYHLPSHYAKAKNIDKIKAVA